MQIAGLLVEDTFLVEAHLLETIQNQNIKYIMDVRIQLFQQTTSNFILF